jgi:uncharacterized protein YecE (DUF72 family)
MPRGFDRLTYLAGYFDAIEINVTFYRQPDPRVAASWARRLTESNPILVTAKLFQGFTHPRSDGGALNWEAEAERYRSGIDPLVSTGLLGAVLMQFPQSFHDTAESRGHLERLAALFRDLPLVAEFRHRSWDNEDALALLRRLGCGFCNIDQPALGSTLGPTAHATSRVAYIRLHGRNAAHWFNRRETASARYDYFYSMDELKPWVKRARDLAKRAEEVVIIANNHYRGRGPANGLMLKAALTRKKVKAPAPLVAAYPDLKEIAEPVAVAPTQQRLF